MAPARRQHIELALVVALSAAALAGMVAAGRFEMNIENPVVLLYDRVYASAAGETDRIEGEWEIGTQGLALPPGRSGSVTVPIPDARAGQVILIVQSLGAVGSGYVASVSLDGHTFRDAQQGALSSSARIDLTPAVSPFRPAWIKVRVMAEAVGIHAGPTVLTRLRVVERPEPSSLGNPALASLLVFTPVLAYLTRARQRTTGELVYSLGVLCGLIVLTETFEWARTAELPHGMSAEAFIQERKAYLMAPYVLLLALWIWPARHGTSAILPERVWEGFALAGILVWALAIRLEHFQAFAGAPLLPDAALYRELALAMNSPYDTGTREPFWIWMVKGWFWLVGDSEQSLRVLTLALSLAVLVAAYKLFRDYTGRPFIGLVVAWLLSQHEYLSRLDVMGLREEAYTLAILCLVYLVLVPHMKLSVRSHAIGLAVCGAALLLLRMNSFVFVIPLLLVWRWKRSGWNNPTTWRRLVLIGMCMAAPLVPHLIHNARLYGDPFYSLNVHAVAARNIEFVQVKGVGCAGCPTEGELNRNLYTGTRLATAEYLFGMHSLRELAGGLAAGYWNMYFWPSDLFRMLVGSQLPLLAYGVYVLGLGLVLFGPHREVLLCMVLLSNIFPFFLEMKILDVRLVMHLAPFVAFLSAYGAWRTMETAVRSVSALRATGLAAVGRAGRSRSAPVKSLRSVHGEPVEP